MRRSLLLLAALFLFAGAFVILLYLNRAPRSVPASARPGVPDSPLTVLNVVCGADTLEQVSQAARAHRPDFIFLHNVPKSELSSYTRATGSLPAALHSGQAILSRHPLYDHAPVTGGVQAVTVIDGRKFTLICTSSTDVPNPAAPAIIAGPGSLTATHWNVTPASAGAAIVPITLHPTSNR